MSLGLTFQFSWVEFLITDLLRYPIVITHNSSRGKGSASDVVK